MTDLNTLKRILEPPKTIAIVGMSEKKHRASFMVGQYLLEQGYTVIPVNPNVKQILGQISYLSLADIPVAVDIVDCFRRSDQMVELARAAVDIGAKVLWMQLDIVSPEACKIAQSNGLCVIMDRCTKIEHERIARV